MKTPELIKKNLGRCLDRWAPVHFESCASDCPYHSEGTLCKETLHLDVLTYIQQLESRLAQVERERDALSYDMHQLQGALCAYCRNLYRPKDALHVTCSVFGDGYGDSADSPLICRSFKWRGVCAENSKEEK